MASSNKKGQAVFDLILLVIVVFVLALSAVFGAYIFNSLNDDLQNDDNFSAQSKASAQFVDDNYSIWFDNVIVAVVVLLWVLLLVTSLFIDAHPVFFIVTVFLLVVVFIAGMAMSNSYTELTSDDELASFAAQMPKTAFIMDNLLIVLIVIGLTTALALYAKNTGL